MKLVEDTRHDLYDSQSLKSCCAGKIIRIVHPSEIEYVPRIDFSVASEDEKLAGGDWDQGLVSFEDHFVYKSLKSVLVDGTKWEHTELWNGEYQAGVTRLKKSAGRSSEECNWWKRRRCEYLEYLFAAMKAFGYKQDPYDDMVSLLIGRHGEVILNNGRHRISMAKLLELNDPIPITIDVRHEEWWEFKQEIVSYTRNHGGMVYAPLDHVDLDEIPVRQVGRIDDVLEHTVGRRVVDLGANWGFMSHMLERQKGISCVAVEKDPIEFSFLEKMRTIWGGSYQIVKMDICDFIEKVHVFDTVLALSIFHHLARTKIGHSQLVRLLGRLDCKRMIFQMPLASEMALVPNCYANYDDREWQDFIIKHSCLTRSREIGERKERRMYCFER